MKTFYIVENKEGLVYCNKPKMGLSTFGKPNKFYDNVIRFDSLKKAEKAADQLNETFGEFLHYKKDKFYARLVNDYTEENTNAFLFIKDFVARYLALNIDKTSVDLGFYIGDDKYYSIFPHKDGFICQLYTRKLFFTLDNARVISGNSKNCVPLCQLEKRIRQNFTKLLRTNEYKTILENPKTYTLEEKCEIIFDKMKEQGGFWETGCQLPTIAEFIARVLGEDVVRINIPYSNFNCFGPANVIADESKKLMPFAKEKIRYDATTTMFYGSTHIEENNFLPFLAEVSVYHIESYDIVEGNLPVFHLKKGRSWREFI